MSSPAFDELSRAIPPPIPAPKKRRSAALGFVLLLALLWAVVFPDLFIQLVARAAFEINQQFTHVVGYLAQLPRVSQ